MQSILLMASAAALLHSTMVSSTPMVPEGAPVGPMPQNGIWALLPTACAEPASLDLSTWAACAIPVGFSDDEVAALEKPGPGKKASTTEFYSMARTKFTITPGASVAGLPTTDAGVPASFPSVAQITVPLVFSRSYYYLAILPSALDADGRFAEAQGWPVACLPKDKGGCTPKTLADVQSQAVYAPTDPQRLYRLVRIRPSTPADAAPVTIPTPQPITEAPLPLVKDAPPASPGQPPATPPAPPP